MKYNKNMNVQDTLLLPVNISECEGPISSRSGDSYRSLELKRDSLQAELTVTKNELLSMAQSSWRSFAIFSKESGNDQISGVTLGAAVAENIKKFDYNFRQSLKDRPAGSSQTSFLFSASLGAQPWQRYVAFVEYYPFRLMRICRLEGDELKEVVWSWSYDERQGK